MIIWHDRGGGMEVKPPVRKFEKLAPVMGGIKVRLGQVSLIQGSQTQSDSRAAWDSKKGLAGRIEKVKKITFKFSS